MTLTLALQPTCKSYDTNLIRTRRLVCRSHLTKAGVQTPATQPHGTEPVGNQTSLNKGRSTNPGNTDHARPGRPARHPRSTKAGVQTPATPLIIILARKLNSQAGLSWKFDYKVQNDLENSRHKDKIP